MRSRLKSILALSVGLSCAATMAMAGSLEGTAGNLNRLYQAGQPIGGNQSSLPATEGNFAGMGQAAGTSGPQATTSPVYPANTAGTQVLLRSTIGALVASGVPRYNMGDVLLPPLTKEDGATPAPAGYWRPKPVLPGEVLAGPVNPYPALTVSVVSASTETSNVVVASVPEGLVIGATLLGEPVTSVRGTNITLAANANQAISGATASTITPALPFYYSPHAEKTYASQTGRVSITWVTPDLTKSFTEEFTVSSSSNLPLRRIYWTEGSFDGPLVNIPAGSIASINAIYNAVVPKAVAEEVSVPGYSPLIPNLKTLYFEKLGGSGQLHAYNVEGRLLIEYLGSPRLGEDVLESFGVELIELVRTPEAHQVQVYLGEELRPHNGDGSLTPSPVLATQLSGANYYASRTNKSGSITYFAERETGAAQANGEPFSNDAYNRVAFYWMKSADNGIEWPEFQNRYWQRWSPHLDDYVHHTVPVGGSDATNGVIFANGKLPQVISQDDPDGQEVRIDLNSQRLVVTLPPAPADQVNRSLLRFDGEDGSWYVNLYTQAQGRTIERAVSGSGESTVTVATTVGLEVGMLVAGSGLSGSARITQILSSTQLVLSQTLSGSSDLSFFVEGDGEAPIDTQVSVGDRLVPPPGHELGGHIVDGTGYAPDAYIDPLTQGVEAANLGAIIPINALPSDQVLTVRWLKKISAPSAAFDDFYVPVKVGRYTVEYPSGAPQIVIASGRGTGDLNPAEAAGRVYVQNDPSKPGYNPNEEHAVMIGTRAYALREDLNITDGSAYTSKPFVLLAYTDPLDGRPAMRAYEVLRTDAAFDFDYTVTAGTLLNKPYPLPLMPEPLVGSGINRRSKDVEVMTPDAFVNQSVVTDAAYNKFTFEDRKGFNWVHRGNHSPSTTGRLVAPSATPDDGHITSVAFQLDGKIIIGGTFTSVGGAPRSKLARLNEDGSLDTTYQNDIVGSGHVYLATQLDGKIIVGGQFSSIGGVAKTRIARLNADGSLDSDYTLSPNAWLINMLSQADGSILIMGGFSVVYGSSGTSHGGRIVRLDADGSIDDSLGPTYLVTIWSAVNLPDGGILIGGTFDSGLHRLNADGSIDSSVSLNTNGGNVTAMAALPDGKFLIGGTFTTINGIAQPRIARLNADLTLDESFSLEVNGSIVRVIQLQPDGKILIGGDFTTVNGVARSRIARLKADGSMDSSFDFGLNAEALSLATNSEGRIIAGGVFSAATLDGGETQVTSDDLIALDPPASFKMKLYYLSRPGFFIPGTGEAVVGTVLPFLRAESRRGKLLDINAIDANADGTPGDIDEPLSIYYRPVWPEQVAELRVGETLTLPKFGLPQVRGQASAEVLYQQSIALADTGTGVSKTSVVLHDSTREKTIALDAPTVGLATVPSVIKTSSYQGRLYFQGLPPHLQTRFYLDPLRGSKGTLILKGEFHDEIAGEDYLNLNLLSTADRAVIKGLVPVGDSEKSSWDAAIDNLTTRLETFRPDPAKLGDYIVDADKNVDVGPAAMATISSGDTAVDSYALTATGQGQGYVTMVFGNGDAFTPEGDPVQVKVFKVARQLYVGDLKVLYSSNPLDEQVTLRHSGDFAGSPEDYEYDWRWAPAAASAPATYLTTMTRRGSSNWSTVRDPGAMQASSAQYAAAPTFSLPRSENVRPVSYVTDAQGYATATVIDADSYTDTEIAAGYPALMLNLIDGVDFTSGVPGSIVFSANLGALDGCVLYVNGVVALAYNVSGDLFAPTNASSGLAPAGLHKQFSIPSSFFSTGINDIEVAVYSQADPNTESSLNFRIDAVDETDNVASGATWQTPSDPSGQNNNFAIIGGSSVNPFGGPQFVLNDRWFTLRYRPKASTDNVAGTDWSRWMPPQLVEGWIKRVLAAINPFNQRITDLYNNSVSTDVSMLTQAGTRWEGDVALTLDNINDVGLIAIYETVLNRASSMSIDANTNDPDTNQALLLAAGYLNDLYTILGNEAYADAVNPTIAIDDQDDAGLVNTSRFAFESQVATSLEEELALLRGRDDFTTAVNVAPSYNRLYWNYTRGINAGEAIYAVNYNIKEKAGSSAANGVIDAADAQRMFPQGHGDAYGHYLTALTGYYQLLTNSNFDWNPRAEAVTVLGQPVTVDYMDERKFAAAAGAVARTAQQVVALTFRQSYKDSNKEGWDHFSDGAGSNPATGVTRAQGLDEWVSRGTQGAFLNWAVANAMVPDVDAFNSGVQKIDRTTIPELVELASTAESLQAVMDSANSHLNPLGLSSSAIAFDLNPDGILANDGDGHYRQIADRALTALNNAAGAFNQSARMTGALRNQENQLDDENTTIVLQERAYVNQLIDIFGSPYSGDIGPGKLYAQDYAGPDLNHWFIVDRPSDLVSNSERLSVTIKEPTNINNFTGIALDDVVNNDSDHRYNPSLLKPVTVTLQASQFVQYNDVWVSGGLGSRRETGELQTALQKAESAKLAILEATNRARKDYAALDQQLKLLNNYIDSYVRLAEAEDSSKTEINILRGVSSALGIVDEMLDKTDALQRQMSDTVIEFLPRVIGLANDATAPARGANKLATFALSGWGKALSYVAKTGKAGANTAIWGLEKELSAVLEEIGFKSEVVQLAFEVNEKYRKALGYEYELYQLQLNYQSALQEVTNVLAKGDRILAEREVFRQRAAAIVQGYRTKDLTFRAFRDESLEQYRSLYDLASRYTYLAAKSYDYETGLLGTSQGQTVFAKIVASRALGDLTDGVPQATTSTLGDAGLAGSLAQLNSDFSVAEGRLGLNNPAVNNTLFSLRGELFRILDDPAQTADDSAWQQTLENHIVADVMADSDVAELCMNLRRPDGSAVPGLIIPFTSTIQHDANYFNLPLAAYDHAFTPSYFATKIAAVGLGLPGYVGMDDGPPASAATGAQLNDALSATPYVYLIPCGNDYMRAPALGDSNIVRSWDVQDQALPLPYNLGANDFNSTQFFSSNGTLSEQPWITRKHPAFRPVTDPSLFLGGSIPLPYTNSRLIGRSAWNGQWKLVIPAYTLLNDEQEGLTRFVRSVEDIKLFLRTYSHSGN